MIQQLKNIDTAFRHTRLFSLLFLAGCILITGYALYLMQSATHRAQQHIYVLANGKVLEAYASERKENIPAEAKDHVRQFHQLLFQLSPDLPMIQRQVSRAMHLADRSAKLHYDNLKESGFYSNLISGNMSQELVTDSVQIFLDQAPYQFRYYATLQIVRPTTIVTRNLITTGQLRTISRTDNNPHGFLIERWTIIDNKDLKIINR